MIQEHAFKLFDIVKNSPHREEIRKVIGKLKSDERGYGNKIYPSPILGLLLWNQETLKEFAGIAPIEEITSWDERELKILYGVHNQIVNFNRICSTPLKKELPESVFAVDPLPYKYFSYEEFAKEFEELLFTKEDAEEMAQIFSKHPAFEVALSNLSAVQQPRIQVQSKQIVAQYISELTEAGVGKNAEWVEHLEQSEKAKHPSQVIQHYLAALVCLNNSLAIINQLIYQAIFQDSLSYLNEGDIIDYLITTTSSGLGMSATYLPNRELFFIVPTDLVLVSVSSDFKNRLCCIYDQSLSLDFSHPSKINMRVIDKNMCSYGWLLK